MMGFGTTRSLSPRVGVGLVVILGGASVLAPIALIDRQPVVAAGVAGVAATAMVALVATGWIGPFGLVIASLPLPAVFESESLRLTLAAPVTAIVVFGWFIHAVLARRTILPEGVPVRTGIVLMLAFIVATAFALHPLVATRELINLGVLGAWLVVSVNVFAERPHTMRVVARMLVGVAAVCGALAVLEGIGFVPGSFPRSGSGLYRAALGFGQPNALGLFLLAVFPFAWCEVASKTRPEIRALAGAAACCIFFGLLFTFSRGSWLAVLAGMTALVLVGQWRWVARAWVAAAVLLLVIDLASGGLLRDTIQRTIGDWVVEQRALLMLAGVSMFLAYPILGVGPGGFAESLDRVGAQIPALVDFKPTPHNAYVQVAAETGVVGLLACAVFILVLIGRLVRSVRSLPVGEPARDDQQRFALAVLWSSASIVASGMVIWPLAHGAGQVVVFVGAMACVLPILRDREP